MNCWLLGCLNNSATIYENMIWNDGKVDHRE